MTAIRPGLRWKPGGRRRVVREPVPCRGLVQRCIDAGQHVPPCRCDLEAGHIGPCEGDSK